jgi:hypothetical protein
MCYSHIYSQCMMGVHCSEPLEQKETFIIEISGALRLICLLNDFDNIGCFACGIDVSIVRTYYTFDLECLVDQRKNIYDILMSSKTPSPSLVKIKQICAWKFVRSSYIG